jgi:hypothetical protein
MKKADVQIGASYLVKVAGNLVPVKIDREHDNGGWVGTSRKTGKQIRIKSPQRLRKRLADPEHIQAVHKADQANARLAEQRATSPDGQTASERAMAESAEDAKAKRGRKAARPAADGKRMSCLDAAAKVLAEAGEPMNTAAMFDAMVAAGYWTSDKATPQNTIYAAILREIKGKGDAARFRKVERGKFALRD